MTRIMLPPGPFAFGSPIPRQKIAQPVDVV